MLVPLDCRLVPVGRFDVLLTDPPYSEHCHESAVSCAPGTGAVSRDFGFDPLSASLRQYLAACAAKAARWSVMYSDLESAEELMRACVSAGATRIRQVPWIRWSMPQLSSDRPPQGAEMLVMTYGTAAGKKSWNGPGWLTHLEHSCLRGRDKHPTEKPLDQALDLVHWFSEPGETVYDPCAGAGTIGLACKLLGREYFGCEINPEHAAAAKDRIECGSLSDRDSDRLGRWLTALDERTERAAGHLAREVKKPKPAVVQIIKMLEAIDRDRRLVA
jgi:hypothetical protein